MIPGDPGVHFGQSNEDDSSLEMVKVRKPKKVRAEVTLTIGPVGFFLLFFLVLFFEFSLLLWIV